MYMHVCAYVYGCMQYTCVYVDIYTHVYTCMNIYIYISQRCTPIHSYHYSHTLVYRVVYALSDIQVYNVVYIYMYESCIRLIHIYMHIHTTYIHIYMHIHGDDKKGPRI